MNANVNVLSSEEMSLSLLTLEERIARNNRIYWERVAAAHDAAEARLAQVIAARAAIKAAKNRRTVANRLERAAQCQALRNARSRGK